MCKFFPHTSFMVKFWQINGEHLHNSSTQSKVLDPSGQLTLFRTLSGEGRGVGGSAGEGKGERE